MQIKIRKTEKKINDLETNHLFTIPENIEEKVKERGFYLYNWIGEKDVKNSLERDFLKLINKFGLVIAFIIIFPSLIIAYLFENTSLGIIIFSGILLSINTILILQFIFFSIKRSNILRKNNYIILTDNYISFNGIIKNKNDLNDNDKLKFLKIENIFEENIFEESKIENTKKNLGKEILNKFIKGINNIINISSGRNSKNSLLLIIILLILYFIYAFSLLLIYIIGIFLVWIFGIFLNIINKKILLLKGHKITKINDNFENIDNYSNGIVKEKNNLENLLKEAINNNWKDSLLLDINKKLEIINEFASKSINSNIELKSDIENSEYKEMFNYGTYNSWIKKQILIPLEQIKILLLKNLETLNKQNNDIVKQLENENDPSKSGPLLASKRRIEMRIKEIQIHIEKMSLYINKLK